MANWNLPALTSPFIDAVDYFKQRDVDAAQMFDVGSPTNIPENAIRFNVSTGVLQRRESGAWVTRTLSSNALSDVNSSVGTYGNNILIPSFTVNSKGQITGVSTNAVRSASTSTSGVVQLNNTTTSTSTTQAATANAVKLAKDAADNADGKATPLTSSGASSNSSSTSGHTHAITTSSSTTSSSTTTIANSAAVKTAYDKPIYHGLGTDALSPYPGGDLNTTTNTGWYRVSSTMTNKPGTFSEGFVEMISNSVDQVLYVQEFHEYSTKIKWRRQRDGGSASSWSEWLPDYMEAIITLDGDLSGYQVKCTRVKNQVIISGIQSFSHTSDFNLPSNSGIIPVEYRPEYDTSNVYDMSSSFIREVTVGANGYFSINYRDWTGSSSSQSGTPPPSISYNV